MCATFSRLFLLFFSVVLLPGLLAIPSQSTTRRSGCTDPTTRVEWTTLTEDEKRAYFEAELCLLAAPAQTDISGVVSRYDDLVGAHAQQCDIDDGNDLWHLTGQFLHVHRYFMHAHETLLRNECGYTGTIPYWNEVVDAGSFSTSKVVLDFGGEGLEANDWDVVDGPFANLTRNLGPGTTNTKHFLTREVNETSALLEGQTYVDELLALTNLSDFRATMFIGIHTAGHIAVGGDMANVMTSPNDPIFWLHHGYVDYVWWKWQGGNETRINDLTDVGYETQREPATGYVETNRNTVLYLFDVLPNATVADVLDTEGGYLCYTYA
ncbi:Di-copper centre-containing protein, partial [Guyanagaster necrorhizus]